jgi:ribosomal protein S25
MLLLSCSWRNLLQQHEKQADKHARKKQQNKTRKIEQENTYGNVQKCNHVQDTEKTSEADSFKNIKVITSYTLEDGHIGLNI